MADRTVSALSSNGSKATPGLRACPESADLCSGAPVLILESTPQSPRPYMSELNLWSGLHKDVCEERGPQR